jgi:ribosomal protein S12 methylthiotransferase
MKIGIVTLGCDKNTVDSEYIAGWLDRNGVQVVRGEVEDFSLDAAVVMTCGFIDAAQEESVHAVQDWIDSKSERPASFVLAVAGCLSQTRADELREALPEIDLVAGVGEFASLADALIETIRAKRGEAPVAPASPALIRDTPNATAAAPQARLRLDQ